MAKNNNFTKEGIMLQNNGLQKWLNVRETAKYIGVCKASIYNLLKTDPSFPKPHKFSRRTVRFAVSDLEAFARSKKCA